MADNQGNVRLLHTDAVVHADLTGEESWSCQLTTELNDSLATCPASPQARKIQTIRSGQRPIPRDSPCSNEPACRLAV